MRLVRREGRDQGLHELALRSAGCRGCEQVLNALQPAELELALTALRRDARSDSCTNGRCVSSEPSTKPPSPSGAIGRSIPATSGDQHAGALVERGAAALGGSQKASCRVSTQEARVVTPEQRRECSRWQGFAAVVACPHHTGQGSQANVAVAHQRYHRREISRAKQLSVHIRWHGGASTDLSVQLPPKVANRLRYPSAIVDRVRELACSLLDAPVAISSIEKDILVPSVNRIPRQ